MTERPTEYVTTHVRLPKKLHEMLKQRAAKENTSVDTCERRPVQLTTRRRLH